MLFYDTITKSVFVMVDLKRKTGITGVPFGRTELSLRLSWIEFGALAPRGGPEGPWFQGMPEKSFFHDFPGGSFFNKRTWKTSEFFCLSWWFSCSKEFSPLSSPKSRVHKNANLVKSTIKEKYDGNYIICLAKMDVIILIKTRDICHQVKIFKGTIACCF